MMGATRCGAGLSYRGRRRSRCARLSAAGVWAACALSGLTLYSLTLSPAAAQGTPAGTLAGRWQGGPMRVDVTVVRWGEDCGPRPRSTQAPGGRVFNLAEQGDHLYFELPTPRTTRGCWSENRAVRRVSSRHQGNTWTVLCRTPTDDPRAETGTYTIRMVSPRELAFRDVSQYDWQLNDSRCRATITTRQSFRRLSEAPTVASRSESPPTTARSAPSTDACTPGVPHRLRITPRRAEVVPRGELCFSTRVYDRQGCPLPRSSATLQVTSGSGRLRGRCFTAPSSAGRAAVTAQLGNLSASARIRIRSLDLSDLLARRTETSSPEPTPGPEAQSAAAARVSAGLEDRTRGFLLPTVLFGFAIGLSVLAMVVVVQRRRRAAALAASTEGRPTPTAEGGRPTESGTQEDVICPHCRRGFPPGTERCPDDGTPTLTYAEFRRRSAKADGAHRRCPVCGRTFEAHVQFCVDDGSPLDPIS